MPSLKEVKNRIKSVTSTRKITSAMKLVASSKLHRAQQAIENMLPYEHTLNAILTTFMAEMEGELSSPFTTKRSTQRAVIVAYSSNSSLCGAFNTNIVKAVQQTIAQFRQDGIKDIEVIPIGAKIAEKVKKMGFTFEDNHEKLLDKNNFPEAAHIAQTLMSRFVAKEIDKVVLIYHHFHSTSRQVITVDDFLPLNLDRNSLPNGGEKLNTALNYIVEPSQEELLQSLIPKVLNLKIYTALLDSCASEHAARVIAMQTATDNADDLLNELTLTYNKTRQAAITAELLDIVGGSFQ